MSLDSQKNRNDEEGSLGLWRQIPIATKLYFLILVGLILLIGLLFMLWSANIWVFALKHTRRLTTKNAVVTVAIPMAVYILYSVWQMGLM